MAASSSLSSSEIEAKNHPYQYNTRPGPKGAFEARQIDGGLYVRVDMPGVGLDGLKINKYSESRTVTFSGKAPVIWEDLDTSERVYGGYVVLDRDPLEVDFTVELKKGCLRLFFPNSEGSLHNLSSKITTYKCQPQVEQFSTVDPSIYEGLTMMSSTGAVPDQQRRARIESFLKYHEKENSLYQPARPDQQKGCYGGNYIHINPFMLSGVEGVFEYKVVKGDPSGQEDSFTYVRMDMPGVGTKQCSVNLTPKMGSAVFFEGEGTKESHYDDGGRRYDSMTYLTCSCCKQVKVKDLLKDGVLRILMKKIRIRPRRQVKNK